MAVSVDVISTSNTGETGNISYTHTGGAGPKGVYVAVIHAGTTTQISGVTYGGQALTEIAESPQVGAFTEPGTVYTYFLGTGVPPGSQTVTITTTGASNKAALVMTVNADVDTEIVGVGTINSTGAVTDPSFTVPLNGKTSKVVMAFMNGHQTIGDFAPLAGWTGDMESDLGTRNGGVYTYDTISNVDVTAGWTQTAEDANAIGVAISEVETGPVSGSGTPSAQAATTAGTAERTITGSGTPSSQSSTTSGTASIAGDRILELNVANGRELRDSSGNVVASLLNIVYEWYDDPATTTGTPTDSGTCSTNANGEVSITLTNSALANGAFGGLILIHPSDSDIRGYYRIPVTVQ